MKNLAKLALFIAYASVIFLINNYVVLSAIAIINILLMLLAKVDLKKSLQAMLKLTPFILITAVLNVLLSSINDGILVGIKIVLVFNITYTFKYILSPMQLSNAIETLFYPLRIFKINPRDISLIVSICLAFIPILSNELVQIKNALKSKGMKFNISNIKYILKPFLYGIFKRTNDVSDALKAKGYAE